ncbi:MAG: DUF4097 family beta strand repeat protein [Candidatus Zixiibacteriota bacterium]|nr:MAG: DUF4097 family beta strand repeat protein [candidate division Zixibacteria bacterium]
MFTRSRKLIFASLLAFALAIGSAPPGLADHKKTWEKTFEINPGGLLTVEADLGSIEVGTSSSNEVEVEVIVKAGREKYLDDFKVEFEQNGNDVSVFGELMKRRSFWSSIRKPLRVEFLITVPKQYNLDLYTVGGSISVGDLDGDVRSETAGGSLNFERINGTVEGRTSGGSISVESCVGEADVKTSGGSITLGEVKGEVSAKTSGGSITVEEVMGMIDAATSGGSVTAYITGQPEDDCRLSTSGGSVSVYLEDDVGVYVDAHTSAGRVETDFPVAGRGKTRKSSLRGKINDGGPELYLRTSGGNIYINEI